MPVRTFDSFEDMFADIRIANDAHDAAMKPWQKALDDGDCIIQDVGVGVPIFARIERSDIPEDKSIEDRFWKENKRTIRAWSVMCPNGELGVAHVASAILKIDPLAWSLLEKSGWPPTLTMFETRLVDGVPTLCLPNVQAHGEA